MPELFPLEHGGRKSLVARWNSLLTRLGAESGRHFRILDDLLTRYGEPQRVFHNASHISNMLGGGEKDVVLELAIWYHDAVFDPTRTNNEELSAELAEKNLSQIGLKSKLISQVLDSVLSTKTHNAKDKIQEKLIDLDLNILGASEKDYARYRQAIRLEYAWVPDEIYQYQRSLVMQRFLDRETIFYAAKDLEVQARENLAREIRLLQDYASDVA